MADACANRPPLKVCAPIRPRPPKVVEHSTAVAGGGVASLKPQLLCSMQGESHRGSVPFVQSPRRRSASGPVSGQLIILWGQPSEHWRACPPTRDRGAGAGCSVQSLEPHWARAQSPFLTTTISRSSLLSPQWSVAEKLNTPCMPTKPLVFSTASRILDGSGPTCFRAATAR